MEDLNVRPYDNQNPLLLPPCIGDHLPEGHVARVVDEVVEGLDLSPLYRKVPSEGNPSYHPKLMIKILFYGYASGTITSRKIQAGLSTDVALIFLSGMQRPDFRTISDFRKNNLKELADIFAQIVQRCHYLGMTEIGTISLDSKVMKANASPAKSHTDEQMEKEHEKITEKIEAFLRRATELDARDDVAYGPGKAGTELPDDIATKTARLEKLKAFQSQLEQARHQLREQGGKKINLTDSDAQVQRDKGRKYPGYRAQVAVESKEQVIVACDVTNEQSDAHQLIPMVDKTLAAVKKLEGTTKPASAAPGEKRIKLLADSGYSSLANLGELEKRQEVDPYLPDHQYQARRHGRGGREDSPYHKNKFAFSPQKNCFVCPAGQELVFVGRRQSRTGAAVALYRRSDCRACPLVAACVKGRRGRTIWVFEHDPLMKKMREKLSGAEGKRIYRGRKCTVEPALGNLAQNLGFRGFLLRTLRKVRGEFVLMCIAHNLKKIAGYVRRRRAERLGVQGLVAIPAQ